MEKVIKEIFDFRGEVSEAMKEKRRMMNEKGMGGFKAFIRVERRPTIK